MDLRGSKIEPRMNDMCAGATILIVDNDRDVREILRDGLEMEGYRVIEAAGRTSLFQALEAEHVDLVTLDLALDHEEGLQLARDIRMIRNMPIILTGRSDPADRVMGLEHGADDYIVKPFHIREVVLRIQAVLARNQSAFDRTGRERFVFDRYVLDVCRRELRSTSGVMIDLTETELRLIELFVRNPARVLSRDEIWNFLRGNDWSPLDRTLDGHVARLRRKIEAQEEEEPRLIKSVRGVGYVLTQQVWPA